MTTLQSLSFRMVEAASAMDSNMGRSNEFSFWGRERRTWVIPDPRWEILTRTSCEFSVDGIVVVDLGYSLVYVLDGFDSSD